MSLSLASATASEAQAIYEAMGREMKIRAGQWWLTEPTISDIQAIMAAADTQYRALNSGKKPKNNDNP